MENNNDLKTYEKWDELDLKEELLRGIYGYGFESPSQIQKIAIKPIIDKKDVIAQAQSGTGKTGTFTISSLQRIDITEKNTQVMILAPTHELVKQIAFVVENIGSAMDGLVVKTLVGGTSVNEDIKQLKENVPHVVVGSTGRVNDMIRRRHLQTNHIKLFILDEADEMLSGGFKEQVYQIFQNLSSEAQIAIFSATLPPYILEMTDKFMNNPVKITMEPEKLNLEGIEQFYLALNDDNEKYDTLKKLFDFLTVNQSIIYVNSVQRVEDLYNAMVADGYSVVSIHSSMKREEREKSFKDFRTGTYRVLISSNVTSRGIDIQQVSIVINFDIPRSVNTYLHRIGRSGRWGRKGTAINFITRQDIGYMKRIESHYKSTIQELPSEFNL
jgi:translation initiation factor 4A